MGEMYGRSLQAVHPGEDQVFRRLPGPDRVAMAGRDCPILNLRNIRRSRLVRWIGFVAADVVIVGALATGVFLYGWARSARGSPEIKAAEHTLLYQNPDFNRLMTDLGASSTSLPTVLELP